MLLLISLCPLSVAVATAASSLLQWVVYDPQGRRFPVVADAGEYADMIGRMAGPDAVAQWKRLEAAMAPLQRGAALFPAAAIRWVLRAYTI